MTPSTKQYLSQCAALYRNELLHNIMPFWLTHGLDHECGGVFTCVDRNGALMDSTKSVWFQGRFAFICAYVYHHIDPNPAYLEAARRTLEFIDAHCVGADGHYYFTVTRQGDPVQKRRYLFSECFAALAMAAYAQAANDRDYARKALDLFLFIEQTMETPGALPPKFYYPARGHSLTMMLINVALVIRRVAPHPVLDQRIEQSIGEIQHYFMHPEYKALLETVGPNGEFIDTMTGRTINPGHCIETAWFILAAAEEANWKKEWVDTALTILDWSWEWGWDKEYGGIINFKDCKNFPNQDYSQDMKFWWPQCEAILATLYAYRASGDEKYLEWHRQIHEYAFKVFPDAAYGEWYGYLHRDGTVAQPAKGNLFKGPFHVPRMMAVAHALCLQILEPQRAAKE